MHPNSKHSNGTFDDFRFEEKVDQSIRYFKVPAMKDKADALNLVLDRIGKGEAAPKTGAKVRRLYFTVGSVAAAASVLLFFMYSFFMVESYQGTIETASNVVFLPDDSRVVLAEGAQLKYSKLFNRSVHLKGEAYFEVEKGTDFYVKTPQGGVLVLGTRFRVADFDKTFEVNCYEGIVGVDYGKEKIRLNAGMQFNAVNTTFDVSTEQSTGYPEFAIFDYQCQNKTLNELWPVVENYFGIDVVVSSSPEETFTGRFHTGNVHEVIEIICTSMKMDYNVINEDQVEIVSKSN